MKTSEAFKIMVKGLRPKLTVEEYKALIEVKSAIDELEFIRTKYKQVYNSIIETKQDYERALKEYEKNSEGKL